MSSAVGSRGITSSMTDESQCSRIRSRLTKTYRGGRTIFVGRLCEPSSTIPRSRRRPLWLKPTNLVAFVKEDSQPEYVPFQEDSTTQAARWSRGQKPSLLWRCKLLRSSQQGRPVRLGRPVRSLPGCRLDASSDHPEEEGYVPRAPGAWSPPPRAHRRSRGGILPDAWKTRPDGTWRDRWIWT